MDEPDGGRIYYETHARFWPWLALFMLSLLTAGLVTDLGLAGLWALAALPLGALFFWRRRMTVQVDEAGLTEHLWPSGERHTWWGSVREVVERGRTLRLVTDERVIRFGPFFLNRRAVALAARRAKDRRRPEPVDAERVEELLGAPSVRVQANVVNRLTARSFGPMMLFFVGLALFAILSEAQGGDAEARAMLWGFIPGFAFLTAWLRSQGRAIQRQMLIEATADRTGVELQTGTGRIHVPWTDMAGIERWFGTNLYLSTMAGDFQLQAYGPQVGRFATAVQRVLEARAAGAELPRMEGISSGSLSRAEEDAEAGVERGLSRAAGDGRAP